MPVSRLAVRFYGLGIVELCSFRSETNEVKKVSEPILEDRSF